MLNRKEVLCKACDYKAGELDVVLLAVECWSFVSKI